MSNAKVDEQLAQGHAQVIKEAKKMSEERLTFVPQLSPKDKLTEVMLEKIPFLSGFLKNIDGTGATLSKLAVLNGSSSAQVAATGFSIGSVLLAFFDLIRIPIMFLAARYYKVELPFTLTHAAKLSYSALILGFALAALLAPAAVLPFIGIASAAFGVAASIIIFGRLIYDLYKNSRAMKKTASDLAQEKHELASIQIKLKSLAEALGNPENEVKHAEIAGQIIKLQQQYEAKKAQVQKLHDKQALLQNVWDKELGIEAGLDKSVAIGLSVGALAGAIVALFFPPLGVAIISCAMVAGTAYLIGRVVISLAIKTKEGIPSVPVDSQESEVPKQVIKEPEVHESTGLVVGLMVGKDHAEEELRKLAAFQHWLGDVDNALHSHIMANNHAAVLHFFIKVAAYAKEKGSTTTDIQCFITNLCEINQDALTFLNQALKDSSIPNQEKQELLAYTPMVEALQQNKMTDPTVRALIKALQQPGVDNIMEQERDTDNEGESFK